ncbi:hypothetical protein AVEN_75634-1 [Araneus ventricosus]|uniref:Mos1 transposase HTH domain-containing protein n=1 Tax=Araneus ventricosus TaxID=182803 RepID=A0A4Y2WI51_ARAVE|nr:hypothetical protein AVEN_75634-1 [Araneus ventricosus]
MVSRFLFFHCVRDTCSFYCLLAYFFSTCVRSIRESLGRPLPLVFIAKGVKVAEIQRQISKGFEENIMSEGMVRKWVKAFKDGRTNAHDDERSGRPSVIT